MAEEESKTFRTLETISDNRDAVVELAQQARRMLCIFTHDLEHGVLDDPDFLEHVKALAVGSRFASINILLVDPARAVREGNRLLEFSRRLSSYVEIRRPHKDYMDLAEAFVVADEEGVLYRKLGNRWEGLVDFHAPMLAREKARLFHEIWQRSDKEPETRRLGI